MENVLEINDLVCRRGKFQLGPINWRLPAGLFCCLVGPNGAGKTTLLQTLMGLIQTQTGSWRLCGETVDPRRGHWKDKLGFALDGQLHHERLSVADNIKLHAALRHAWDRELAAELIRAFHLDPSETVGRLSRGQRQALGLILALAHRPKLLLLDEITNGMDSLVRKAWDEIVFRVMEESEMSVIMATHVMSDVDHVADNLLILNQGRIVAEVDKDSLHEKWRQLSCRIQNPLDALPGSKNWERSGESLRFVSSHPERDLQTLKKIGASLIEARPLTLDEICYYTLEDTQNA